MEQRQIDRSSFVQEIPIKAIRLPATRAQSLLKSLAQYLFNRKGFPKIAHVAEDCKQRLLLLRPDLGEVPAEITALELPVEDYTVKVAYEHLSYGKGQVEEVMKQLLPAEVIIPTGFETVGHLAHFNLSDSQLPYKHLIGQVVIDVPFTQKTHVKTVVNKLENIHNTFRTFEMELIAGDPNFTVTQKEGNCYFSFDFRKVYWSSKLSNERQRLLQLLRPGEVLCDLFAGVGPLSVQAAKKGLTVIANDLNPECYESMLANAAKNKVSANMHVYNLDARAFFRAVIATPRAEIAVDDKLRQPPFEVLPATIHHVYMNLPMDALDFVDVFVGAFEPGQQLPLLHIYAFSALEDPWEEFVERITGIWGQWDSSRMVVIPVRDVAPRKMMFCVQMELDPGVAYHKKRSSPDPSPDTEKRPKLD